MKVSVTPVYNYKMVSPKGKKFDEVLLRESDILDPKELATMRVLFNGHGLCWSSPLKYDIAPSGWEKIFSSVMVDED